MRVVSNSNFPNSKCHWLRLLHLRLNETTVIVTVLFNILGLKGNNFAVDIRTKDNWHEEYI